MIENNRYTILVVDDDVVVQDVCVNILQSHGYKVLFAAGARQALEILRAHTCDLILCDLKMPEHDGHYLLTEVKKISPRMMFIIMTAYASIESAVACIKNGAYDFISKPFKIEELLVTIERAIEQMSLANELNALRSEVRSKFNPQNMIGFSPAMQEVARFVEKISGSENTVLIQGETGAGKDVLARVIHYNSPRRDRSFVKINCSALSATLIESELFGHEKGAFTGAATAKKGLFETAEGGTVFLDEIGDMPLPLQVKLLQVLEHGIFRRVGGTDEHFVNIRVIAATNKKLEEEIVKGTFRSDLFHRLNILFLTIPPLRERRDDIPLLVQHFIETKLGDAPKPSISENARQALSHYNWPGNIRELQNTIERALAIYNGKEITLKDLPESMHHAAPSPAANAIATIQEHNVSSLEEMEKQHILSVMKLSGHNKTRAAELLGITRLTLRNKIEKYGIPADLS